MLSDNPWDDMDLDVAGWGGSDVGNNERARALLERVIGDAALSRNEWVQVGRERGRWGEARVCQVQPERVLHVVGDGAMASALRELLAQGSVPGWHLNPVEVGETPLHVLAGPLLAVSGAARYYNVLRRSGFTNVEELAATPDTCLLNLPQSGPKMVTAIRQVLRDHGPGSPKIAHPVTAGAVAERRALMTARLTGEQRVRYKEFAELLAFSSLPGEVLEKIADSLNAEGVPPADPLVGLMLDTAGEADLARYYRSTHARPSGPTGRTEMPGSDPEP